MGKKKEKGVQEQAKMSGESDYASNKPNIHKTIICHWKLENTSQFMWKSKWKY